jgi:hypothetical protein
MSMVDVEFRYPAVEPQVKQLAQLCGLDPNRIVMNTVPYEESMAQEAEKIRQFNVTTDTANNRYEAEQARLAAKDAEDLRRYNLEKEQLKLDRQYRYAQFPTQRQLSSVTTHLSLPNLSRLCDEVCLGELR